MSQSLTDSQVAEIRDRLFHAQIDINNYLSVIVAHVEVPVEHPKHASRSITEMKMYRDKANLVITNLVEYLKTELKLQ